MVQARLEKLDPSARRVLRAASLFGTTFWRGGVEELIGGGDTAAWLAVLVDQGVIELKSEARFADEVEYKFQHTLIQEAAYETLTSDDHIADQRRSHRRPLARRAVAGEAGRGPQGRRRALRALRKAWGGRPTLGSG